MHNPEHCHAPPPRPATPIAPKPAPGAGLRWAPPRARRGSPARGLIWAVALSALFWSALGLLA